jgi:hypothetical protein
MKIYRVAWSDAVGESRGYSFHSSRRDASIDCKRMLKANGSIGQVRVVNVAPTRRGIISALNKLAGHPDNG